MAIKTLSEKPKITDTVLFELQTTDSDGNLIDPYKVDRVIIYFLSRDFQGQNFHQDNDEVEIDENNLIDTSTYFSAAESTKVFGTDDFPAWLSTDTENAQMELVDTGSFELLWNPEFANEGDYIICWTWTPLLAGDQMSSYTQFILYGDTRATTSIPTHFTPPEKYETLLDRYMPEMLKLSLGEQDQTPDVINRLNKSIADGFTTLENLANQIVDLIDANAVNEKTLPYLAGMFDLVLRSDDTTLWRRQIKRAVPLFKRKGTERGLEEALAQAGIQMTRIQQLWQVISPSTWQEAFVVSDETSFELAKLALLPVEAANFEVYLRPDGDDDYIELTTDYVDFTNTGGITTMTWIGDSLSVSPIELMEGDIVRVIYKIAEPDSQAVEDYIRSLPLADQRDERDITYPIKNWNVRLIDPADTMFDVLCPTRNPFLPLLIYGKIRTEFAYSENLYNKEEYNGSLRDSLNPCDIDRNFLDPCSCCVSSYFSIDVEVENLSDDRVSETTSIITEYTPFHALIHTINFAASVNEFVPPQIEQIEMLLQFDGNEYITFGQDVFTRYRNQGSLDAYAIRRDALADAITVTAANGTGKNDAITLYSPGVRFDRTILGINENFNLLEILTGPDTGEYKVGNPSRLTVDILQGVPDTIGFPLDKSEFLFRLSNRLFSNPVTSVTPDDLYIFSDDESDFRLSGIQPGWMIEVTAPALVVGTYTVVNSYPDDTVAISGWPTTTDVTGITYQLKTDLSVDVGEVSTSGAVAVTRRALVVASSDIRTDFGLIEGDYALIAGTQYRILEFVNPDEFYIEDYTSGALGITACKIFRRLLDNAIGFLDYRGHTLVAPANHEAGLGISNGANELGPLLENNKFKENFLVKIGDNHYQIAEIDKTILTLVGPAQDWGIAGSPVSYSIIQLQKDSPVVIDGTEFFNWDRRNREIIEIETETVTPMALKVAAMNSPKGIIDTQLQQETISIEIEWKKHD